MNIHKTFATIAAIAINIVAAGIYTATVPKPLPAAPAPSEWELQRYNFTPTFYPVAPEPTPVTVIPIARTLVNDPVGLLMDGYRQRACRSQTGNDREYYFIGYAVGYAYVSGSRQPPYITPHPCAVAAETGVRAASMATLSPAEAGTPLMYSLEQVGCAGAFRVWGSAQQRLFIERISEDRRGVRTHPVTW